MSGARIGKPDGHGSLAGSEMSIDWTLWGVNQQGRHPIDLVVTFRYLNEEYKATAEFEIDAIARARIEGEEEWKRWLLQMATMTVRSAIMSEMEKGKTN